MVHLQLLPEKQQLLEPATFSALVVQSSLSNDDESHDKSSETEGHSSSLDRVNKTTPRFCPARLSVLESEEANNFRNVFGIFINSVTSER